MCDVNGWAVAVAAAVPIAGDLLFFEPQQIGLFLYFCFMFGLPVYLVWRFSQSKEAK